MLICYLLFPTKIIYLYIKSSRELYHILIFIFGYINIFKIRVSEPLNIFRQYLILLYHKNVSTLILGSLRPILDNTPILY